MFSWRQVVDFSQPLTGERYEDKETVTPMRLATVIRLNEEREREATRMRWGWPKPNSKVDRPEYIHARAETIDVKPTFREAFERRRGILVVKTFNEGKEITPTKTDQYTVTPRDGKPLGIAVIWDAIPHPMLGQILSFVMVTVEPNKLISTITDRMPAVLEEKDWPQWLGEEEASISDLKAILKTYEGNWDMAYQPKPSKTKKPIAPTNPGLF